MAVLLLYNNISYFANKDVGIVSILGVFDDHVDGATFRNGYNAF